MDFTSALTQNVDQFERPPIPPIGHYLTQVDKHPDQEDFTSKEGKTFDRLTYILKIVSAGEDVDEDDLAAFGNVNGYILRKTFIFSRDEADKTSFDRSLFQLRQFLEHLGVETEDRPLNEALADSVGQACMTELKHRPDPRDVEIVYAEAGKTTAAE